MIIRIVVGQFISILLCISVAQASFASDRIPSSMQGYWADSKKTCEIIYRKGVYMAVGKGEYWLKITKTDILGHTVGRLLEVVKPQMLNMSPAKASILIQDIRYDKYPLLVDLTLALDGRLYETITSARASMIYIKCKK